MESAESHDGTVTHSLFVTVVYARSVDRVLRTGNCRACEETTDPKSPAKIQPLVYDVSRTRSLSPQRVIPHRKRRHRGGERWVAGNSPDNGHWCGRDSPDVWTHFR